MAFKAIYFIFILFIILTSCVLTQKKEIQNYNEPIVTSNSKIKVYVTQKNISSSFYSANVDTTEERKLSNPDIIKAFENTGFEIADFNYSEYLILCTLESKTSTYVPKNGQPFYFILKYFWTLTTVYSLGLIPYYNQIDHDITINVINNISKMKKTYAITLSYETWISIFLIHKINVKNVKDEIAGKDNFDIRKLLDIIKSDIDMKKI